MDDKIATISSSSKANNNAHVNQLPAEIVGRFLQNLSVGDRLKGERVSPHWKQALSEWGWTEQRKLDADIVLEGANEEESAQFWGWNSVEFELVEGGDDCNLVSLCRRVWMCSFCCGHSAENSRRHEEGESTTAQYEVTSHLIHLFQCIGQTLRELDLHSFGHYNIEPFAPEIAESLELFPRLEKLNIQGFKLRDFLGHLASTLRELTFSVQTMQALADRCPNLEEVPLHRLSNCNDLDILVGLIGKFPRQKRLELSYFGLPLNSNAPGALMLIGQLKALEELDLFHCEQPLDGASMEAIVGGCPRLRSFRFNTNKLKTDEGAALFLLAKMPNLTDLGVNDRRRGVFSDAVLKAIAERGKLKTLLIRGLDARRDGGGVLSSTPVTDDGIVFVLDRCKSLSSLCLYDCPQITMRSFEAVVAEVQRRHGWPPRALPSGPLDPGVLHFKVLGDIQIGPESGSCSGKIPGSDSIAERRKHIFNSL